MADRILPDCLRHHPLCAELDLPDDFDPRLDEHVDRVAGQLLHRFRVHDDGRAFELLVELCLGRLVEIGRSLTHRYSRQLDPEELVARFLERLFVEPRRDQPDVQCFLGMAFQTMRFDALNQIRLQARSMRRSSAWEASQIARRTVADPASVVGERDLAASLLGPVRLLLAVAGSCFGALRPHERTILFHRELEGLSYDDIAQVMDIPRSQVGMVLKRAREHFAQGIAVALRRANAHCSPPYETPQRARGGATSSASAAGVPPAPCSAPTDRPARAAPAVPHSFALPDPLAPASAESSR